MPHRRSVRYAGPLVAWHELELAEAAPGWSDTYRAQTPRLLIPDSAWIEAEQAGQRFVCDALTPLALTPEVPYRTRQPHAGQRSIVLVVEADDGKVLRRAARWRLGPAAHWRLAACRAALERGDPDRLALEEALLALLQETAGDVSPAGARRLVAVRSAGPLDDRTVDRAVERARELVACDPSSTHSLHEIACAAGVSPFQLARRFKRVNGIGVHGYRTRLRMALAMARLCAGDQDLTGLAFDLGYSSHSHFTATFKAHFGVPPSQARSLLAGRAGFR